MLRSIADLLAPLVPFAIWYTCIVVVWLWTEWLRDRHGGWPAIKRSWLWPVEVQRSVNGVQLEGYDYHTRPWR